MPINVNLLVKTVTDGAKRALGERWPTTRAIAEVELEKLARSASEIERLVRAGDIDEPRARLLFEMHRHAARGVLVTIEGIGVVTAEEVTLEAARAVAGVVARAAGINLL